jgi:hypothetical protein
MADKNQALAKALRTSSNEPQYIRGNLLPFKKDIKTKEVSFGVPTVAQGLIDALSAPYRAMKGEIDVDSPQGVQEALNFGLNMMGGGLGATAIKPVEKGAVGMFVGTKGIDNLGLGEILNHAKKLKEAKVPDEQIWSETSKMIADKGVPAGGITFKFGNKPQLELDDSMAKINPMAKTDWNYAPLSSILEHPTIYKAEPSLKSAIIEPGEQSHSFYNPATHVVNIGKDHRYEVSDVTSRGNVNEQYKFDPDVVGHEVNHTIQFKQNLPQGGNFNTQNYLNEIFNQEKKNFEPALQNIENAKPTLDALYRQNRIQDFVSSINKPSYKPRDLYKQGDFYKYSDQIRSQLGQMPKKPGQERDNYIRNANQMMFDGYVKEKQIAPDALEAALAKTKNQTKYQINKVWKQLEPDYLQYREFSKLREKNMDMNDLKPHQVYNNLTGEAQSRLVQDRWNMTPQERAANYPYTKEQLKMNPQDLIDLYYK